MSEVESKELIQKQMDSLKSVEIPETLNLNGKILETSKARPISLGDQRALKKKGANLRELSKTGDPDVLAELFYLFCRKMNPDITMDDIDSLTPSQMTILSKLATEVDKGVDRPI